MNNQMKTGDLVLFTTNRAYSRWSILNFFAPKTWVHAGVVVKDPPWLETKGMYLWESTWGTGKVALYATPLHERIMPGHTYYRSYKGTPICPLCLHSVYQDMIDNPHEGASLEWVKEFLGYGQKEPTWWDSGVVARILSKLNIIQFDPDQGDIEPSFFGSGFSTVYSDVKKLEYNMNT
jgi:hypothetical protein